MIHGDYHTKNVMLHINGYHGKEEKIRPEAAIATILEGGGIPVLAHGIYGDGGQLLDEEELHHRIPHLKDFGWQGMELDSGSYRKHEKQRGRNADWCRRNK